MRLRSLRRLSSVLLLALPSLAFAQGALAPSGAPAATMKSLDQIEARTPIGKVGGSTELIAISQPGSYVLLGNVTVATGDAIDINAGNVTLDLNGFMLSSFEKTPSGTAIDISGHIDNVTVRNGHIRGGAQLGSDTTGYILTNAPGFEVGLRTDTDATNITVENLKVSGVYAGILARVDGASTVRHCSVTNCATGITGGLVADCIVRNCVGTGIYSTTATDCHVTSYSKNNEAAISTNIAHNCIAYSIHGYGLYADCATNCEATTSDGDSGLRASSALACRGEGQYGAGLAAYSAENCQGISSYGTGLVATNATNCNGYSGTGTGLVADNATNCRGTSFSGTGLDTNSQANGYTGTATGCTGRSTTGHGLIAAVATNCTGHTTDKSKIGVWVSGTATGCRGNNTGVTGTGSQTAVSCTIAVACTATTGTIVATSRQLGTP